MAQSDSVSNEIGFGWTNAAFTELYAGLPPAGRLKVTELSGDNAPLESFWRTLKTELVHHRRYQTRREAARELADYIDLFYNRRRRQARLGYLSPAADTQQFMRRLAA